MPEKMTLYQQVSSAANVLAATHNTLKHGRRYKGAGAAFSFNKEQQMITISNELQNKTYKPGRYERFFIYEPKKREVLAAPLKDRVVHHALHDVVEPLIDRKFIFDSYACRKNKGTHKAILRAQRFLQANTYFVHLDVKKYFPSIDHRVLKGILRKHFHDTGVLNLFDLIIESSLPQQEKCYDLFNPASDSKGLPIGNLTSQFLANLYLNEFDQYIKHELKCRAYLRYMDDFVLFHHDRKSLNTLRKVIHHYCNKQLLLSLHEKGGVKHHSEGLGFLGFKIYRTHRLLKGVCLNRYMRKYKRKQKKVLAEKLDQKALQQSVICWQNHLMHGDTQGLMNFLSKKYHIQFRKEASHE